VKLATVVKWCQVLYIMELVQKVATRLNGAVQKKWYIMYLALSL